MLTIWGETGDPRTCIIEATLRGGGNGSGTPLEPSKRPTASQDQSGFQGVPYRGGRESWPEFGEGRTRERAHLELTP
jgi:hypothetical protein